VRVVVQGGAAPVILDGQSAGVMAGPDGQVLRVDIGEHFVTVRGAGDIFAPSQYHIKVSANDTVRAIFRTPEAADPAPSESTSAPAHPDSNRAP
jgi:hypothetical protein